MIEGLYKLIFKFTNIPLTSYCSKRTFNSLVICHLSVMLALHFTVQLKGLSRILTAKWKCEKRLSDCVHIKFCLDLQLLLSVAQIQEGNIKLHEG